MAVKGPCFYGKRDELCDLGIQGSLAVFISSIIRNSRLVMNRLTPKKQQEEREPEIRKEK